LKDSGKGIIVVVTNQVSHKYKSPKFDQGLSI
jgi:hypothetical protein